jgi:hypothetical protein
LCCYVTWEVHLRAYHSRQGGNVVKIQTIPMPNDLLPTSISFVSCIHVPFKSQTYSVVEDKESNWMHVPSRSKSPWIVRMGVGWLHKRYNTAIGMVTSVT